MVEGPNQQGLIQDQKSLSVDVSALVTALQFGNQQSAAIVNQLKTRFAAQVAINTRLAVVFSTAGGTGTLVSSSPCYLISISVTTPSTGPTGLCYDSASIVNSAASNAFMVIPASGLLSSPWPCQSGLVVQPSSQGTHTVSVSYI